MESPGESNGSSRPQNVAELLSNLTEQQTRLMDTYKGFLESMQLETNLNNAKGQVSGLQKAGAELIELQKDHLKKMLTMLYPIFQLVMPRSQCDDDDVIQMLKDRTKLDKYDLVELSCVLRCYFAKLAIYIYHMATFVQDRDGYERVVSNDPNLSSRDLLPKSNPMKPTGGAFEEEDDDIPADAEDLANMTANGWYERMSRLYKPQANYPAPYDIYSASELNMHDLASESEPRFPSLDGDHVDYKPRERVPSQRASTPDDMFDPPFFDENDFNDVLDPTMTSYAMTQNFLRSHDMERDLGYGQRQHTQQTAGGYNSMETRYHQGYGHHVDNYPPDPYAHSGYPHEMVDPYYRGDSYMTANINQRECIPLGEYPYYQKPLRPEDVSYSSYIYSGREPGVTPGGLPPGRYMNESSKVAPHKVPTKPPHQVDTPPGNDSYMRYKNAMEDYSNNRIRPVGMNDLFNMGDTRKYPAIPEDRMIHSRVAPPVQRRQQLRERVRSPNDDICCSGYQDAKSRRRAELRQVMSQEMLHPSFYSQGSIVREGVHVKGDLGRKDITHLIYDSPLHNPDRIEQSEAVQQPSYAVESVHDSVYSQSSIHTTLNGSIPLQEPGQHYSDGSHLSSIGSLGVQSIDHPYANEYSHVEEPTLPQAQDFRESGPQQAAYPAEDAGMQYNAYHVSATDTFPRGPQANPDLNFTHPDVLPMEQPRSMAQDGYSHVLDQQMHDGIPTSSLTSTSQMPSHVAAMYHPKDMSGPQHEPYNHSIESQGDGPTLPQSLSNVTNRAVNAPSQMENPAAPLTVQLSQQDIMAYQTFETLDLDNARRAQSLVNSASNTYNYELQSSGLVDTSSNDAKDIQPFEFSGLVTFNSRESFDIPQENNVSTSLTQITDSIPEHPGNLPKAALEKVAPKAPMLKPKSLVDHGNQPFFPKSFGVKAPMVKLLVPKKLLGMPKVPLGKVPNAKSLLVKDGLHPKVLPSQAKIPSAVPTGPVQRHTSVESTRYPELSSRQSINPDVLVNSRLPQSMVGAMPQQHAVDLRLQPKGNVANGQSMVTVSRHQVGNVSAGRFQSDDSVGYVQSTRIVERMESNGSVVYVQSTRSIEQRPLGGSSAMLTAIQRRRSSYGSGRLSASNPDGSTCTSLSIDGPNSGVSRLTSVDSIPRRAASNSSEPTTVSVPDAQPSVQTQHSIGHLSSMEHASTGSLECRSISTADQNIYAGPVEYNLNLDSGSQRTISEGCMDSVRTQELPLDPVGNYISHRSDVSDHYVPTNAQSSLETGLESSHSLLGSGQPEYQQSIETVMAENSPVAAIVEEPPDSFDIDPNEGHGEWINNVIRRDLYLSYGINKTTSMPPLDDDNLSSKGIHIPPLDMSKLRIRGSSM
ncbi:hypothetical protein BBOV_I000610 [Babesia bovis T2Bo]|uniref:Uncharacterized protein n=1 Tax=Babesia bovis TaxID=5865 RepID=A7AX82_BABBO|nr:hypothetical protein BBOV_I000610 [Babesia bovis T2Bo]EDO05155.1 hypothetical protein BBOV_I000610 [Babesia bovis T2Bo]|eukprot:XP_001608723.1 hypothetical protein [Babesia bovis T2Bo]